MNSPENNENNSSEQKSGNSKSFHRHKRHRKRKLPKLRRLSKYVKRNPLKIVAPFFIVALIVLSILFFLYDDGKEDLIENEKILSRNNPVKGILLPMNIINEKKALTIDFGRTAKIISQVRPGSLVSLEKLSQGYTMSPMSFINCGDESRVEDSCKFILTLEGGRIFVSAGFKYILNDEVAGLINKDRWTLLSKNISRFYSDDNLFEVLDNQGNVIFNMQFNEPDLLSISGYFIGTKCIYIAGDGSLNAQPKIGNYVEKALQQIRNIKRIYNYN